VYLGRPHRLTLHSLEESAARLYGVTQSLASESHDVSPRASYRSRWRRHNAPARREAPLPACQKRTLCEPQRRGTMPAGR